MPELNQRFFDDKSALADEFVLGVLTLDEREAVLQKLSRDTELQSEIQRAETQFSCLNEGYVEVKPSNQVQKKLGDRLFPSNKTGFWQSLPIWRTLTAASLASVAILAVSVLSLPETFQSGTNARAQPQLIASLEGENSDVKYLALYQSTDGTLKIRALSGSHEKDQSFELWLIEGANAPKSLGLLPDDEKATSIRVSQFVDVQDAKATLTFAISLEPAGGSTTGAPTGPVVAVGQALEI